MVEDVDLWLNNPWRPPSFRDKRDEGNWVKRRTEFLQHIDGWWDEGYTPSWDGR
ncbi:MAG: hypothetical protein IPG09_18285 [Ignavibacteria bacterium]|nr:hypothetical protein [Ignavibacteria bacterium]